jgi:hypothetical protein
MREPGPRTQPSRAAEPTPVAIPLPALAASALVLAGVFALDSFVLRTPVLTPFVAGGVRLPAATPLYAFWLPALRPAALLFVACAGALVWLGPRLCDPQRTRNGVFALALASAAWILPLTLFLVRQPLHELGALLTLYPDEEVVYDALRIHAYLPFLEHYVEGMPGLSLHGKHFPPGHASVAYGVLQIFGAGTRPLALVILAAFAAALLANQRALAAIAGERAARGGALLLLACPSLLDFACTSFDALFLLWAALAFWSGAQLARCVGTASPVRLAGLACATGAALFAASFASFSALPLGLAIGLQLALAGRRSPARAGAALAGIAAAYLGLGILLFAATGFSLLECLQQAIRLNEAFIYQVLGRDPAELRAHLAFGNGTAFGIGSGVALCATVGFRLAQGRSGLSAWSAAAGLTLAVMILGGIYFMETERIWLFAMPWLAAAAVATGPLGGGSLRMLMLAGLLQSLAMESLLLTLW